MLTVMSLFSGIGGLDLAAEWAGMQTVMFCEKDTFCQQILKQHWPNVPVVEDVRNVRGMPVDVVTGGYPCQPFSHAGRRAGHGDERHLWPEMLRIVRECNPSWVVGENVKGHLTLGLDEVLSDLADTNYEARAFILPACAVGANHARERVFIVAHHNRLRVEGTGAELKATRFDERIGCHWQTVKPRTMRMDDGSTAGTHRSRIQSIGNAVVPQQAYPIFAAIKAISERVT